jgi:hypothetical protein
MQIELLNGRLSHHLNCEIAVRSYGNSLTGTFSLKIDRKPADDVGSIVLLPGILARFQADITDPMEQSVILEPSSCSATQETCSVL